MPDRVPDNSIIVSGQGEKGEHMEAFGSADKSYEMIYLPVGKTITINTNNIEGPVTGWWFNPKDGRSQQISSLQKKPLMQFTSPTTGTGNDWVLVIDETSKGYKAPGSDQSIQNLK